VLQLAYGILLLVGALTWLHPAPGAPSESRPRLRAVVLHAEWFRPPVAAMLL
jgi:hypothetical protein